VSQASELDRDRANLPVLAERAGLEAELVGQVVESPSVRQAAALRPVVLVVGVVLVVVRHEHTRRAGRHLGYIPLGAFVLGRRLWESRTTARYERMIRAAEQSGNHAAALEWDQRRAEFVRARHERKMQRRESMLTVFKIVPRAFMWFIAALIVLGLVDGFAHDSIEFVIVPFTIAARVVEVIAAVVSVAWGPVLLAVPWLALGALWHAGRAHAATVPGGWLSAPSADAADGGMVVTADTIVVALKHMPVPALGQAFREGWRPVFTLQPVRDGRGYEAEFSVPLGVTAEMIADRRPVLARNLHRDEIETWPSAGSPGYVKLWVADRGAVSNAAPEYPLLHEGAADVFEGVPGGVSARGDGLLIPVVGNNGVLGGMMGQGKSNGARVLMLGCATDPLCGLDVFTFANNGDFDAYAPRLATYRKGLDDEVIEAAVERLHELYRSVGEREQMLADLHAKKVTRQLAQQYPELRPHVSLFSECHELFGSEKMVGKVKLGELAGELAVKTAKRARKTAEVLWFDTQSSRKSAIPPALVELVSVNCCFAVKSWRSNDGFLGDGSFAAGIRATELRPGRDRGTSLVTGISDAQFELLKWYFIVVDDDTGYDAAADVIARAMASIAPGTPVAGNSPAVALVVRDLLGDVAEVVAGHTGRVRVADLPAMLRKLAPAWGPYRDLNGVQLRGLLDDEGVRTTNTGNVRELDPADLHRVVAERERQE
jgi:DNA segregation ATPase FtsK/SpoIIIE, S-DNA-T family